MRIGLPTFFIAFVLCPIASVASAAVPTSAFTLCEQGPMGDAAGNARTVRETVAVAETAMADTADRAAAGDRAIGMIEAAAGDGALSDPATLAQFCIAAGQAYWLGRTGNPYQARAFLADGFRYAQAAAQPALSALAAYRLAAVTVSSTTGQTRGLRRTTVVPVATAEARPVLPNDPCALLDVIDPRIEGAAAATLVALRCAVDDARSSGDADLAARSSLRLARYWLGQDRGTADSRAHAAGEARASAESAIPAALTVADPARRTILLGRLVGTALDAEPRADATLARGVAAMRAGSDDPALAAEALGMAARLALAGGDRARAAALLREAIFREAQTALPARLPYWYLLLAQADPENRAQDLAAAQGALDAVRPLLGAYDSVTEEPVFGLYVQPVFAALVADRLAPAAGDGATGAAAQIVVEQYRQAELESVFGSACVATRSTVGPQDLRPDEIVLYPVLLPDRVELLYAEGGQGAGALRFHRLSVPGAPGRDEVLALAAAFVEATSAGGGDRPWRDPARRLYDVLIAPIADRLHRDGTLVVVPEGALSGVPFSALLDPDGHFLVERTRVGVVPSLAYSQLTASRRGEPEVVAASLQKEVVLPYGVYDALPAAAAEARDAVSAGAADPRRNLLLADFTRAELDHALADRPVDLLHLATHANFNGRSDRSYIVANGELIPIAELRAMIARNRTRGGQLDLLVLSACETAVGDDQASMGLAGAAVQAGARSALASLWSVDDAATAALMRRFYERYRATGSKTGALRDAQLAMIAGPGDAADPSRWAAFTMLGNWR